MPVDFSADQVEQLRGQLDQQAKTLKIVDRRLTRFEAHESDAPPWTGAGGPGIADFLSQTRGSPGIVADAALAREPVPCICYEIQSRSEGGPGKDASSLCFKHGIVGALDEQQTDMFCATREDRVPSPEQGQRLEDFQSAANACKPAMKGVPPGQELDPWMSCMTAELRARGRTLSGTETVDQARDGLPYRVTSKSPNALSAQVVPSAVPGQAEEGPASDSSATCHPGLTKYARGLASK